MASINKRPVSTAEPSCHAQAPGRVRVRRPCSQHRPDAASATCTTPARRPGLLGYNDLRLDRSRPASYACPRRTRASRLAAWQMVKSHRVQPPAPLNSRREVSIRTVFCTNGWTETVVQAAHWKVPCCGTREIRMTSLSSTKSVPSSPSDLIDRPADVTPHRYRSVRLPTPEPM